MATRATTIGRKGRVTIPVDTRRDLGLHEGDRVAVECRGEAIVMDRLVAERTAGVPAAYRLEHPPSIEDERTAFEEAVAAEGVGSIDRR